MSDQGVDKLQALILVADSTPVQPANGVVSPAVVSGGAGALIVAVILALINKGTELFKEYQGISAAKDNAEASLLAELVRNQNGMITQLMQHLDASGTAQRKVLEEIERRQTSTGEALARVSELLSVINADMARSGLEKNAVLDRLDLHVQELGRSISLQADKTKELSGHIILLTQKFDELAQRIEAMGAPSGSFVPLTPRFKVREGG